jgi:ABC-type transporter Mla subunit MlaD
MPVPDKKRGLSDPARTGLAALAYFGVIVVAAYVAYLYAHPVGRYHFGVRFVGAAGLGAGAPVYVNGVSVGVVSRIHLLPDGSVDLILDLPRDHPLPADSQFSVQPTVAGSPTLAVTTGRSTTTWPERVLPPREQPVGATPLSIEDFLHSGLALGNRANRALDIIRPYRGKLKTRLIDTRANGAAIVTLMRGASPPLLASIRATLRGVKGNLIHAQSALAGSNRAAMAQAASSMKRSAADLQQTAADAKAIESDPKLRKDARAALADVRATAVNADAIVEEMKTVAGNSQTRAELNDASARLKALLKKL